MDTYIGIKNGNIITILLPIHMIIYNILFFIKNYYKNKFNLAVITFLVGAIITTFYFYICNYSKYFIASWGMNSFIAPFFYGYIIIRPINSKINSINPVEKILYFFELIIGVVLIIIPFTHLYTYVGIHNSEVLVVSKILIFILGIVNIFLNKFTINCILKPIRLVYKEET